MKFFNISLIAFGSASLLFLGACSSDDKAAKTESTTTSTPAAKTETTIATKTDVKGEKFNSRFSFKR
jgi:protein involved in sex pheromone biosynthesis